MTVPVRLAIAGLGMVTQLVYLPLLARNRDLFTLTAICDLSPQALVATGEACGIPASHRHRQLEDLLAARQAETLLLATSGSHGAAARGAQEAGIAVLCEKPLSYTLAEADALEAEPPLVLGYMKLHDPAVVAAAEALDRLGPLRSVEVLVLHPSPANQLRHLVLPPPPPLDDETRRALTAEVQGLHTVALGPAAATLGPLYSDVVLGSLVHDLAVMRRLAGEIASADHVEAWPADAWPPSIEVSGAMDTGTRFALRWHYLADHPEYAEEIRLHGTRATLTLRFPTPYVLHARTRLAITERHGTGTATRHFGARDEAFEAQLRHFHAVVTRGAKPAAGIPEGRRDIVAAQRIVARLAERRGIRVTGEAAAR